MPFKANEPRRHKIPKARCRVQNWPKYDKALQRRGSLTVWVAPEAIAAWQPPRTGRRGRPRDYSEVAIETGRLLRPAFGQSWRQTEGLLRSIDATSLKVVGAGGWLAEKHGGRGKRTWRKLHLAVDSDAARPSPASKLTVPGLLLPRCSRDCSG